MLLLCPDALSLLLLLALLTTLLGAGLVSQRRGPAAGLAPAQSREPLSTRSEVPAGPVLSLLSVWLLGPKWSPSMQILA